MKGGKEREESMTGSFKETIVAPVLEISTTPKSIKMNFTTDILFLI
jgi:hypothetical protein